MTDPFSPAELSRIVADDFLRAHALAGSLRGDLANRLQTALQTAIRHQREADVALCFSRRQLWERTADRPNTPAGLEAEARARANEAAYLEDAIAAASTAP